LENFEMKKTLVAVAALVATGAFADVTIGGHIDQGYLTTTTNGTNLGGTKTTALAPILAPNLLTFSGSEDLGSGNKASFKMESSFTATGLSAARETWVAVSGAFGTVTAGQQYHSTFFNVIGTDPNGFNNLTGLGNTALSSSWGPGQTMLQELNLLGSANTVSYKLPTLVEGVGITAESISGATPGNGALVNYANGGLYAGYSTNNFGAAKATSAALTYDFGVAKIGYTSIDSTSAAGVKTTDSTYTIGAPVGPVNLGLSAGTNTVAAAKANNAQLGASYSLSKRTSVYAVYGKSSNTTDSVTNTAFGVAHNF
jgi:predicted porin